MPGCLKTKTCEARLIVPGSKGQALNRLKVCGESRLSKGEKCEAVSLKSPRAYTLIRENLN
jgi:hypothetical protein